MVFGFLHGDESPLLRLSMAVETRPLTSALTAMVIVDSQPRITRANALPPPLLLVARIAFCCLR